jgi:hypothetical protein
VHFEVWLLGQTKDVQIDYWEKLKGVKWVKEDVMPKYSIFEIVMLANPDFDNSTKLHILSMMNTNSGLNVNT